MITMQETTENMLNLENRRLTKKQEILKRIFDMFISTIGLIMLFPVFLIIAIMVKLVDGGPIIYKQERLTKDGKLFTIYKFRTMIVDAEKNGAQLSFKNDKRLTSIGKVLRHTHLDELPQLWNILIGDMSLVGPRPERQEFMNLYLKECPEFKYRLNVKAGLTGYSQICCGDNNNPKEKINFDLMYMLNYSFIWDLKLMLLTVKHLVQNGISEKEEDSPNNV